MIVRAPAALASALMLLDVTASGQAAVGASPVATISAPLRQLAGPPVVAIAPNGRAAALWVDLRLGIQVAIADARGRWGRPERIGPYSDSLVARGLAVDSAGDALATWVTGSFLRGRVLAAARVGGRWRAPVPLSAPEQVGPPRPGIASDGSALVVWSAHGSIRSSSRPTRSGRFRPPETVAVTPDVPLVAVAFSAPGHALAAWRASPGAGAYQVAVSRRAPRAGWGPTEVLSTRAVPDVVEAGVDDTGHAVVAWLDRSTVPFSDGEQLQVATAAAGAPFAPAQPLGSDQVPVDSVALAVGATGAALILWTARFRDSLALVSPGATAGAFGPPSAANVPSTALIGVDRRGRAMAVWERTNAAGRTSIFASRGAGGRFEPASRIAGPFRGGTGSRDIMPAISAIRGLRLAVAPGGRALVSWSKTEGTLAFVRSVSVLP